MSYTDQSDSDLSNFESQSMIEVLGSHTTMQNTNGAHTERFQLKYSNLSNNTSLVSGRASTGGPQIQAKAFNSNSKKHQIVDSMDYMPQTQPVEPKKLFHPFAEKPSPYEEWKTMILMAFETLFQFITMDIIGNLLYYLWKGFEYVVITPVAVIGLIVEFIRKMLVKVSFTIIPSHHIIVLQRIKKRSI